MQRASDAKVRHHYIFNDYIGHVTDMSTDMCTDTCTDMCADMCTDMYIDMCTDMCTDMCIDMCIDTCTDMWAARWTSSRLAIRACFTSRAKTLATQTGPILPVVFEWAGQPGHTPYAWQPAMPPTEWTCSLRYPPHRQSWLGAMHQIWAMGSSRTGMGATTI